MQNIPKQISDDKSYTLSLSVEMSLLENITYMHAWMHAYLFFFKNR